MPTPEIQPTHYDEIRKLDDGSIIQHGKYNDRVYLMKISNNADDKVPSRLIKLAKENNYSKIFAKVPAAFVYGFINSGFGIEALVPGLYNRVEDGFFLTHYLNSNRFIEQNYNLYEEVRTCATEKISAVEVSLDNDRYRMRKCRKQDVGIMAKLYSHVFSTYPFPIHDPEYLLDMMQSHVRYFCIEEENSGKIVALSSSEIDEDFHNAEMTDFATHPYWRGNGFGVVLLKEMERYLKAEGIKTFYTIARAASYSMNITFAKSGYKYGGRLKNNTNISGEIESMNVWYKTV